MVVCGCRSGRIAVFASTSNGTNEAVDLAFAYFTASDVSAGAVRQPVLLCRHCARRRRRVRSSRAACTALQAPGVLRTPFAKFISSQSILSQPETNFTVSETLLLPSMCSMMGGMRMLQLESSATAGIFDSPTSNRLDQNRIVLECPSQAMSAEYVLVGRDENCRKSHGFIKSTSLVYQTCSVSIA